jgi:hypothetical protein
MINKNNNRFAGRSKNEKEKEGPQTRINDLSPELDYLFNE